MTLEVCCFFFNVLLSCKKCYFYLEMKQFTAIQNKFIHYNEITI